MRGRRAVFEYVAEVTAQEYLGRMIEGWRHFGSMLFRPSCPQCKACRTLRVLVDRIDPVEKKIQFAVV